VTLLNQRRLLLAVSDEPAASETIAFARLLASAGARVGIHEVPGAARWFGAAALEQLLGEGRAVERVAASWEADALLVLGGAAAKREWQARRAELPLVEMPEEGAVAASRWLLPCLLRALSNRPWASLRLLVTAGPTVEHFDAVRFLSNPSSGKMGYALAEAAWIAGAEVTLVSGPTAIETPWGIRRIDVTSAQDMREAVLAERYDLVFMAAAVSDYRPVERRVGKVKKGVGPWTLEMERTPDILAELSASVVRPELLIGFAAETHDIERYALEKLRAKSLDGIVANDVGAGGAFGSDSNCVQCYDGAGGAVSFGPAEKREIAAAIVAWAEGCLARKR